MVAGRTVLELGSGCGLTGLCASLLPPHAAPSTVSAAESVLAGTGWLARECPCALHALSLE